MELVIRTPGSLELTVQGTCYGARHTEEPRVIKPIPSFKRVMGDMHWVAAHIHMVKGATTSWLRQMLMAICNGAEATERSTPKEHIPWFRQTTADMHYLALVGFLAQHVLGWFELVLMELSIGTRRIAILFQHAMDRKSSQQQMEASC
jgi:hypothetical protein